MTPQYIEGLNLRLHIAHLHVHVLLLIHLLVLVPYILLIIVLLVILIVQMTLQYIEATLCGCILLISYIITYHVLNDDDHLCPDDTAVYRGDALWRRLSQLEAVLCTHTLESRLHDDDDDDGIGDNEHYFYYFLDFFAR